jgi:hypothetical protein
MPQVRIELHRHAGAQALQGLGGLDDTLLGNVRIGVAAAQQDRRAGQRAAIVPRAARRANETATQPDDAAETLGMAHGEFEGQAGALRKAEQEGLLGRDPGFSEVIEDRRESPKRRGEVGLVALDRRQETKGIPGV